MSTVIVRNWHRLVTSAMVTLMVLGMIGLAPGSGAAQGTRPAPTVGEIVVDSFDCVTGEVKFHVPVTNLPSVPEGTSGFDYPLTYNFESFYAVGSSYFPTRPVVFTPAADDAPFTGNVSLSLTVPTTNLSGVQPGTGAITSIDLRVAVGYGGFGYGAFANPTGTSTTSYTVDCSDEGTPDSGFVARLVAVLVRVLSQIFNQ
jgi:hypothetical protein